MKVEAVVIVRLSVGDDLIALLEDSDQEAVKLEHPHYVRFNPLSGTISMFPFCSLSDETRYTLPRSQLTFVVPSNKDLAYKFISLLQSSDTNQAWSSWHHEAEEDPSTPAFIDGNDTKH